MFASVGLQPHPVVISSHSAGAHHHVSSGDGTQGHGAAGGVCVCDRHCSVMLLMTVCCVTRVCVCVLTDLSGVSAVSAVSTALLQSRRSASHAAGEENDNCVETLIYVKN